MGGGGLRLHVPCGIQPARHAKVGAVARHDPLACRRRIRRRERCRLRSARCMMPPFGGTVSAWQSPGGKRGGVPAAGLLPGGHGAANRRHCTAALWTAQNGGGVAPAEWRVQRTPNGVLSLPGLVAGPVSAWQLPGGALSGGVPPDIMRGGAYCPAAIAAGRSWGFGLGPGRRTEADGVATGPRACNRRHGYGPVGAGMGSEWRKVEEGTGACGRTRAYAWGRGRRGHRQDRETA